MLAAPIIVIIGALWFYLTGGRYESTQNAALQTGMVAISASISGKASPCGLNRDSFTGTGNNCGSGKPALAGTDWRNDKV